MYYRLYSPTAALAGFIKCYWSLDGEELAGTRQRIFPDGCIELVFHYGGLFQKYHPDGTVNAQPRSFIHGQLTRFIEIGGCEKPGMFSARFHPQGLKPFIDISTQEINDDNISIEEIWGAAGRELEDRMLNAAGNEQRVMVIEQFLLRRLQPAKTNEMVNNCVALIGGTHGAIPIQELSAQLNTSRRHLERQFISAVGLSPKQYARITRFQQVLALAEQKRYTTLTSLAYNNGFYDQAHFIRDFREFAGLSPKQFFAAHPPLAKLFMAQEFQQG